VKNDSARKALGLPRTEASSFSELTSCISSTGPQRKGPANPPIDVDTAGMTFVKSISLTSTPGDT
jgi:hypothetical protein